MPQEAAGAKTGCRTLEGRLAGFGSILFFDLL